MKKAIASTEILGITLMCRFISKDLTGHEYHSPSSVNFILIMIVESIHNCVRPTYIPDTNMFIS